MQNLQSLSVFSKLSKADQNHMNLGSGKFFEAGYQLFIFGISVRDDATVTHVMRFSVVGRFLKQTDQYQAS
jgi:hypothetical protein